MPAAADPTTALAAIGVSLRRSLQSLLPQPGRVILAVSGGADSVALLHAWRTLRSDRADELHVAHFDHQLRSDSAADAAFVQQTAAELGLVCTVSRPAAPLTVGGGRSLETAAREARYQFLIDVARQQQATVVATAHTQGDQVESVLHAILRGSGLKGLAGMRRQRPLAAGISLIRPLLDQTGLRLRQALHAADLPWREDPTNTDTQFTRNWLRHELLPLLRSRSNPQVDDALLRLAASAEAVNDYVDADLHDVLATAVLESTPTLLRVDPATLRRFEAGMLGECWRRLWERTGWPRGQLSARHLRRLVELTGSHGPSAWDLPAGVHARRQGRPPCIVLSRQTGVNP